MIIYIDDARRKGKCVKGVRKWCKAHHIDFDDALKNGIDSEILLRTNDSMAINIVKEAENVRRIEGS